MLMKMKSLFNRLIARLLAVVSVLAGSGLCLDQNQIEAQTAPQQQENQLQDDLDSAPLVVQRWLIDQKLLVRVSTGDYLYNQSTGNGRIQPEGFPLMAGQNFGIGV